ncbi:glycerophosphodiester phosphodiesterase [Bacillus sp. FJAT-49711]|uniref:glycerophosphodiester phosphodiesterase n=1 Tax=Bacillus sp. FJAT-49711 TaxID=2833585 RepID=UPI001BC91357|nr:glycerophosphodiester phosphodiesterase [Bacillus sp. FJAT-49711]MBS4217207.1 glycerophosphodiester phosphodiesterase [Bacillus sp. FJAT-49711]
MTIILAHRGSAGTHPENTMESFVAAEQFGADGIELDVHLTLDGDIAVIHDTTVDRTTDGNGRVTDFTMEELKKFKANYHYKHFFKKTARIPSLKEVFEWMKGNNLICNIELKNNELPYEGLEEKVISLIKEYKYEKRIVISSFNHYSLVYIVNNWPEIETAPLYSDLLYKPWEYANSLNSKGIHPKLKSVSDTIIKTTMENGISVRPYTVNKERDIKRLLQINCSAIITDFPEKAVKLKRK